MMRFHVFVALLLAGPQLTLAQTVETAGFSEEHFLECELERSKLVPEVVATNTGAYAEMAERTMQGWLVYDPIEEQVIELDDELKVLHRWGRQGEGPMEYRNVSAMVRNGPDQVMIFDERPPSLLVFGRDQGEYRLDVPPHHAVMDRGRVVLVDRGGLLHEVEVLGEQREARVRRIPGGAAWEWPEPGSFDTGDATPRLKPGHVGFLGASEVWAAEPSRQVLQRCLHDDLMEQRTSPPKIAGWPYTIPTMTDYAVLASGDVLTLGGLRIDDEGHRAIELYDGEGGGRIAAWSLDEFPGVRGSFDPRDPRRILVWNQRRIEGVALIEVDYGRPIAGTSSSPHPGDRR